MQGEALLDIRKRPSAIEKGVSLISKYNYLYSHLSSSHILLVVFTPLSIRRGDGGEAVDGLWLGRSWTVVRLVVPLSKPITPLEETNLLEFFLHTCFLFIGHVLEGNTVRSEVETEQFHYALTAYDVTTEVTDNIDHCL